MENDTRVDRNSNGLGSTAAAIIINLICIPQYILQLVTISYVCKYYNTFKFIFKEQLLNA